MTDQEATLASSKFPSLSLDTTAFTQKQLIAPEAPQIAFAGRSNVGKSSLINALAGRKALAKVSASPGKTRSINYYKIDSTDGFLVDLPGYGYAKCSHDERNKWAELLTYYFTHTPGLTTLFLLIDARLSPQKADLDLLAFAQSLGLLVTPVLTKTDKCNKKELGATLRAWGAYVHASSFIITSSSKKQGIPELWQSILNALEQQETE